MKLLSIILYTSSLLNQHDTIYFDDQYIEVTIKEDPQIIRINKGYNELKERFEVLDYTSSWNKIFEGDVKYLNTDIPDGNYTYFFENGQPRTIGHNQGHWTRDFSSIEELWFPNGIKQATIVFDKKYIFKEKYDSLGNFEIIDRNDKCVIIDYSDQTIQNGNITNGYQNDMWHIYDFNNKLIKIEHYDLGKFKYGERIVNDYDVVKYNHTILGDDIAITNQIKRKIKKQISNQFETKIGRTISVAYKIHIENYRISKVQLLKDQFMIEKNIDLEPISVKKPYIVTVEGLKVDTYNWVFSFEMNI